LPLQFAAGQLTIRFSLDLNDSEPRAGSSFSCRACLHLGAYGARGRLPVCDETSFSINPRADNVSTMRGAFGFVARSALIDSGASSGESLRPPRAAAIAGIVFSVLLAVALGIIRVAVPSNPASLGAWLIDPVRRRVIGLAIQLVPVAGIAFLWFIGVLRNRLGKLEDQFFASVLLGSGLMFVACLFGAGSVAGAFLEQMISRTGTPPNMEIYEFARRLSHAFINIFAVKMAAVFMFSSCTIAVQTSIFPRWIAFLGFAGGLTMLLVIANWGWIALIFPLWMLVVSVHILFSDLHRVCEPQG
jgi:hypothetical protein